MYEVAGDRVVPKHLSKVRATLPIAIARDAGSAERHAGSGKLESLRNFGLRPVRRAIDRTYTPRVFSEV
jgi:hypothetical protein